MDRLKCKRALITGGTTGIGLETARRFAEEGARVIATGTNPKTLDAARKELGDSVTMLASDAASVPEQKKLAQAVQQQFGQLDILFINAGVVQLQPLERWDEAAFDRSFNVKGPVLPRAGVAARLLLEGLHRGQWLGQRTHRHAKHHGLRRNQGLSALLRAHAHR
jgi:NAD(P)-dependent dehydrogenase (short-subunit alcohol dehydrogenase family)